MILYIEKSQATHFFSSSIQFFSYIFFFCYLRWKSIHFVNDADTQTMNNILVCCISKWISFIFVVVVVEQYFLPRIWMEIGIFTVYTIMNDNFWMMFSTFDKAIFRQHTQICLPLSIFGTIYKWFLARLCYSQRCEWGSFFRCMATTIRNIWYFFYFAFLLFARELSRVWIFWLFAPWLCRKILWLRWESTGFIPALRFEGIHLLCEE